MGVDKVRTSRARIRINMSIIHGQEITARDVEQIVGSQAFDCARFAGLCNAILWSSGGHFLPFSLTERVLVKDSGIDAELYIDLAEGTSFFGPGWNVVQYKQRGVLGGDRKKIFAEIKKTEAKAVCNVYQRTGRRHSTYIIFVNLDLSHKQKEELKKAIVEGYDQPDSLRVEMLGAAEIASALNNLPHLRSSFFANATFQTRAEAWEAHVRQSTVGAFKLVGRGEQLASLKALIDNPEIRAVIIYGPWGIGKSRIVLEATNNRPLQTVFAVDPHSLSVSDLVALRAAGKEIVVVIEELSPVVIERYIAQALAYRDLKVVITTTGKPSLLSDKRVAIVELAQLDQRSAESLFKEAWGGSDFGLESWVISQAGGNSAVLLHAAAVGPDLRKTAGTLVEEIAEVFEDRIRRSLGIDTIESLQILSLLTYIGVSEPYVQEIDQVAPLFGKSAKLVLNDLPALVKAGIVRLKGPFAGVTPLFLANRLALSCFRGDADKLFQLLVALDESARFRFMRRLSGMTAGDISRFWDGLFSAQGLFNSFDSVLENLDLLQLVSATVPDRVAPFVEQGLMALTPEEVQAVKGDSRRAVMWVVEQLLFRRQTSAGAVRCLAVLAEAENELWSNNATGVLCECFLPRHPQLPLTHAQQLELLREIVAPARTVRLQLVGIKAISTGLGRMPSVLLRETSGPLPLDSAPPCTYGEIWSYVEELAGLLVDLAMSSKPPVASAAAEAVPDALFDCFVEARPENALRIIRKVIESVAAHNLSLSVSRLIDRLRLCLDQVARWREQPSTDPELANKQDRWKEELKELLKLLDADDFENRLRRWAGEWSGDHTVKTSDDQDGVFVWQRELRALAKQALDAPSLITDELLNWLCSREAQHGGFFFHSLGEMDATGVWSQKIDELGRQDHGAVPFANYFSARARKNPAFAAPRLDELAERNELSAKTLVLTTWFMPADLAAIRRIVKLLREGRIERAYVEQNSHPSWFAGLNSCELQILLEAVAESDLRNAMLAIRLLDMWLYLQKPIEGTLADFAWQCLESTAELSINDAYHYDHLAANLAKTNPEKAFVFFEKALRSDQNARKWRPTDRYGAREHALWNALIDQDRARALSLVLNVALSLGYRRYFLTQDLRELANLETDAETLLKFALQSEQHAEVVTAGMTSAQPGFWQLAFQLIDHFPKSRAVRRMLSAGAEKMGEVHVGQTSSYLTSCLAEIERTLVGTSISTVSRQWLEGLRREWTSRIQQMLLIEATEEVNELRYQNPEGTLPQERLWAIRKLIQDGKLDVLARVLTRDDMLSFLPRLDLSEREMRKARASIQKWRR